MGNRKKVLIIEDEISLSMAISIMLMKEYEVLTAASAKEARLLFTHNPDLILTDIRLPDVKGLEFIKEVKDNFIDKPIIVMSCLPEWEISDSLTIYGITSIIRKPFSRDEILEACRCLL